MAQNPIFWGSFWEFLLETLAFRPAEYPSTPKEILKSVATRLRRHAECRLPYRGHV